jgi:hypothetical protein
MPKLNQLVDVSSHNLSEEKDIEGLPKYSAEKNICIQQTRVWRKRCSLELLNEAVTTAEVPDW